MCSREHYIDAPLVASILYTHQEIKYFERECIKLAISLWNLCNAVLSANISIDESSANNVLIVSSLQAEFVIVTLCHFIIFLQI